jgi:hypothetical protein
MHASVSNFIMGATRLGARPKTTQSALFFEQVSLEIKPSLQSNLPKTIELVWPCQEHDYDVYASLLYSAILGSASHFSDFMRSACEDISAGCGHSESHGEWAVRMYSRQDHFHLQFVDMKCLENRGHCGSRVR